MRHLWHTPSSPSSSAPISLAHPLTYADRLRIRQPGDAHFALGPHMDGGSLERWERDGYGRGGVYDAVFAGRWEQQLAHDAWDAARRVGAVTDLYGGLGACSVFRAFQGWLGLSATGPGEGTLLVRPNVVLGVAYALLRPFFRPVRAFQRGREGEGEGEGEEEEEGEERRRAFLHESNWEFTGGDRMTSELQGASMGHGLEFPSFETHPQLELDRTMVHIPRVEPGDYVAWHCDSTSLTSLIPPSAMPTQWPELTCCPAIHAVDKTHNGTTDSSALYIPACPLTEANAAYVARQRQAFLAGAPAPDFPGGKGEAGHVGRGTEAHLRSVSGAAGLRAMGFGRFAVPGEGAGSAVREAVRGANAALGF
jgi:hypothetical protein